MLAGRTICDVDFPDVIRSIGRHMVEQVGVDVVFQITFAQIGPGQIPVIPISRMHRCTRLRLII